MMTLLTSLALAQTAPPIINGVDATEDDWPSTGALIADVDFGGQGFVMLTCSSTLIAPDTVLLAAHCVDELLLTYGFGTLEGLGWSRAADQTAYAQGADSFPEDAVMAWDWVQHPDWDVSVSTSANGLAEWNDIALVFLEEPVTEVDFAYLLQPGEEDQLFEGVPLTVVGWGQQGNSQSSTYGVKQMGESWLAELGTHEFQVGKWEEDVRKCHGDSGGPSFLRVITDATNAIRLVGVTSHAYDDSQCEDKGGVDTRVDAYRDWIEAEMASRCQDGTRAWCVNEGLPTPLIPDVQQDFSNEPPDEGFLSGCSTGTGGGALAVVTLMALIAVRTRQD